MHTILLADVTGVIIGMGIFTAIFLVVTIIQSSRQVKGLEKKVAELREKASREDLPGSLSVGDRTTGNKSPPRDD
ncbi:MAG: hypothetical protein VB862_02795 [Pirellulaceae bacterium]|jgi:hypothetical protein